MMTQQELTALNLGENLDQLMNLDPRGYGVCRILYKGCRDLCGEPVSLHTAKGLIEHIHEGDLVYILTGFVLLPHKKAEMDGIVSSVLLARALVKAFGAKPGPGGRAAPVSFRGRSTCHALQRGHGSVHQKR